ncbi:MAG TPA: VanZ family protein [Candidatus Binataceae bacterium]|nr:VanZ family protein [Candidatus Binataceae bacterium]
MEAALRFRILLWIVLAGWIVVILALGTSYFSLARTAPIIDPIIRWFAPSTAPETEYDWNVLVRWSAHFGEYAILFAALAIGPMRRRPLGALALCIACATLDEGLQWLRPARSGMIWDVALDTSGAAATMLLALPRWLSMRG